MTTKPIYLTRPHLPPLEDFLPYLRQIWDTRQLTNGGTFHQQFEQALAEYLGVPYVSLFANGTLALITALQGLRIAGEVITTPFSFVATTHALHWNGIRPIFVDIRGDTCNLDEEKIEAAITPQTTAILPVHCYGNPCAAERIEQIADAYGLKVIYDAAHAFGVTEQGRSVLNFGDLSVLSFHATKTFNTFEGGAIVCHDIKLKRHIDHLKNFGFVDETRVVAAGINGKMNEFQAALGLLQLKEIDGVIARREAVDQRYRDAFAAIPGITCLTPPGQVRANFSYFPILVEADYPLSRDALYEKFRSRNILVRRYFHPLISDLPMYRSLPSASPANLPQARRISERVLCLPIYPDMAAEDQQAVIDCVAA